MKLSLLFLLFSIPLYSLIDEEIDMQQLRYFWNTSPSTWGHSHYYTLEINGEIFQGLRPWKFRWELYNKDQIFEGKKVIDLGSNIGIPSIFIKKYGQASLVFAVEKDPEALSQQKQLQEIFNVDIICYNLNFDHDDYEKILGYDYDIALCASTFHWIANSKKERFLHYLSYFNQVLYEGHESLPTEMHRFRNIGFKHCKVLGQSDYNRWIILFSKTSFEI
jgi:SAM-dependent methyltransferase